MEPEPEDLAEFFRTRKIGFGRCLKPAMQCNGPANRAHSILNRQAIALLEEQNHVLAWQPRFSQASPGIALMPAALDDDSCVIKGRW